MTKLAKAICLRRQKNYSVARREEHRVNAIRKLYVKADAMARGQTMAEYALILAAVAVVVFVGYQTMGTTITGLLTSVDGSL